MMNPHLLYIAGDDIDFVALEHRIVAEVPRFPLGPFCWIVLLQDDQVFSFAGAVSQVLPKTKENAEFLLCRLSFKHIAKGISGDGCGLNEWIKNARRDHSANE